MIHSNNDYNKKLKYFARKLRKDSTPGEIKLWVEVLSKRQMMGYLLRGMGQLLKGRGDRARQCVINAGIQVGFSIAMRQDPQ